MLLLLGSRILAETTAEVGQSAFSYDVAPLKKRTCVIVQLQTRFRSTAGDDDIFSGVITPAVYGENGGGVTPQFSSFF